MSKFNRTVKAATKAESSDRVTRWDLIEAIAYDAVDDNLPITSQESVHAASNACSEAGLELSLPTVQGLCLVAKFDYESYANHRKVWRRYGWTTVKEVAAAGWSQEAGAELLGGRVRKTKREVEEALRPNSPGAIGTHDRDRDAEVVGACRTITNALEAVGKGDLTLDGETWAYLHFMQRVVAEYVTKEVDLDILGKQIVEGADALLRGT